jgi:flagellar FliL protein
MVAENEQGAEGLDVQPKKRSIVPILIAVNVVVLGGIAAFVLLSGSGDKKDDEVDPVGKIVELKPFVVNLNESRKATRFLKVKLSLELKEDDVEEQLNKRKVIVRDRVIHYLRDLTVAQCRGSENMDIIRRDLKKTVNAALGQTDAIKAVYFSEIVDQ